MHGIRSEKEPARVERAILERLELVGRERARDRFQRHVPACYGNLSIVDPAIADGGRVGDR